MQLETLRQVPYLTRSVVDGPIGLIIVRTPRQTNVMTVSFFSEVAHFPASLWVAIAPERHTHGLLLEAGRFSFITLHQGQAAVAVACGTVSGRERDKATDLQLYQNGEGFLFLEDALASSACLIDRSTPLGDHTLVIARILSGAVGGRQTARRQLLLSDLKDL